jgi:lipoprotein-releasing system permease protein
MFIERFIAKRYLVTRRKIRLISIITLISIIGVSIGVGALIAVLSVFNGFNKHVTGVLVGFDPHIRIEADSVKMLDDYNNVINKIKESTSVEAIAPYTINKGVISSDLNNLVVFIKGVDDKLIGDVSGVKEKTRIGEFKFNDNDEYGGIILGINLLARLDIRWGDTISVISPAGMEKSLTQFVQPKILKFILRGAYDSDNRDYDKYYAFVSIPYSQRLFDMNNSISGLEIKLDDINRSDDVKTQLESSLGSGYKVSTWYDLHKDLYSIMQVERWTAYVILSLIIAVATFNIAGSLTMTVIEKKRDIGILKSMGAANSSILKIFMYEGVMIGIIGAIIGSLLGFTLGYLQIHLKLFPLDPTVYPIDALPIDMRVSDFITVSIAAFVLCTVASLYPALRAALIKPIESIRWE